MVGRFDASASSGTRTLTPPRTPAALGPPALSSPASLSTVARMLIVACVLLCFLGAASSVQIDLTDGGYEDVHVSINKEIPYDESIVENLKVLFQSSSEFLHQATNGRVYFKKVIIELPYTWPKRTDALGVSENLFEKSDVRVDVPTETRGDRPFTQQLQECGKGGDFIQVTPGFLAQVRNATARYRLDPAYVFVHEWAHFRYGVFDEYGSRDDSRYPLIYCNSDRKVSLNVCSSRLKFRATTRKGRRCKLDKRCRLTEDCMITIFRPKWERIESSIMFMPYVANVSQFCDNSNELLRHNIYAPSKQNDICEQRSTWEVISENDDFKALPKPDMSKRIQVAFQEKQQKEDLGQRIVLVLDVSESMGEYNGIEYLKAAASHYINDIEDGCQRLAVVTFSDDAKVLYPLTAVNVSTRQGLLKKVAELNPHGAACIGCGIKKALEVLNTGTEMPEGAIIVVVTGGQENREPKISTVMSDVVKAKVTVNTVAVGVSADPRLEKLAMSTKGMAYLFDDLQGNLALQLETAFLQSTTKQLDDVLRTLMLVHTVVTFNDKIEKEFPIDGGVGNKTVVVIQPNSHTSLRLKSWLEDPSGKVCQECKETADGAGTVISIPSPAKVGTWKLHLETDSQDKINVTIQVKSKSRGGKPITLTSKVGNIIVDEPHKAIVYAKVSKGKQVVLNAVVRAEVFAPNVKDKPNKWTIQLHDDGRDPDNHANDGTYSGYFTKFVGKGRYAVVSHVSNQNGTRLADALGCSGSFSNQVNVTVVAGEDDQDGEYSTGFSMDDFDTVDTPDEEENETTPEVSKPGNTQKEGENKTTTEMSIPVGTPQKDENNQTPEVSNSVDDFSRISNGDNFDVTKNITEEKVPPGKIRDLSVAHARPGINRTLLVKLTWTWPGAHMTEGKASAVTIRASEDHNGLKSNFDNQTEFTKESVVAGNLDPLPSGATHVVTVVLPEKFANPRSEGKPGWTAYIAARVTNSDGVSSNTSNIVDASYTPAPVTTTRAAVTTKKAPPGIIVVDTTEEHPAAEKKSESSEGILQIWAWFLILIVAAVVIAMIVLVIMNRAGNENLSGTAPTEQAYKDFESAMESTLDTTTA